MPNSETVDDLVSQLQVAAFEDLSRAPGQREAVPAVAEPYLSRPCGGFLPTGEQERYATPPLLLAVAQLTGQQPLNHVHLRALLRRWALKDAADHGCLILL